MRPRTLALHGGTLNLAVHDAYFLARYTVLRRQMIDCHPDRRRHTRLGVAMRAQQIRRLPPPQPTDSPLSRRGVRQPHATGAFRLAQQLLARWLAIEDAWYASLGLEAPPVSRPTVPSSRKVPTMKQLLMTCALVVLSASSLFAQDTLKSVSFTASPDQTATMADGSFVLTSYELVIDRLASSTAVPPITAAPAIATINLGKPTPVATVITITNLVVPGVTLTAGNYQGRLAAIGPGGRSADLVGPFSQPFLPRPALGLTVVR